MKNIDIDRSIIRNAINLTEKMALNICELLNKLETNLSNLVR